MSTGSAPSSSSSKIGSSSSSRSSSRSSSSSKSIFQVLARSSEFRISSPSKGKRARRRAQPRAERHPGGFGCSSSALGAWRWGRRGGAWRNLVRKHIRSGNINPWRRPRRNLSRYARRRGISRLQSPVHGLQEKTPPHDPDSSTPQPLLEVIHPVLEDALPFRVVKRQVFLGQRRVEDVERFIAVTFGRVRVRQLRRSRKLQQPRRRNRGRRNCPADGPAHPARQSPPQRHERIGQPLARRVVRVPPGETARSRRGYSCTCTPSRIHYQRPRQPATNRIGTQGPDGSIREGLARLGVENPLVRVPPSGRTMVLLGGPAMGRPRCRTGPCRSCCAPRKKDDWDVHHDIDEQALRRDERTEVLGPRVKTQCQRASGPAGSAPCGCSSS